MPLTADQIQAANDLARVAVAIERKSSIPAELTIAQSILESGWKSKFAGNNCLGIKTYPGCFGEQLLQTREWFTEEEKQQWLTGKEGRRIIRATGKTALRSHGRYQGKAELEYEVMDWFATFPTLEACFDKRTALLTTSSLYKPAFDQYKQDGDFASYLQKVAKVYAKSPDYVQSVTRILGMTEVKKALDNARGGKAAAK